MVQVSSTTKTQTCTFCGIDYIPKQYTPDAKKHCCGKKMCAREYDRQYKMERRDAVDLEDWDAITERFGQGEEIASFKAVISGGRFTASGGAQLTLTVNIAEKYKLVDVTDYSGMIMEVSIRRPAPEAKVDDDAEE